MNLTPLHNSLAGLSSRPLVVLTIAFTVGILLAKFSPLLALIAGLLCILLGIPILRTRNSYQGFMLILGFAVLLGGFRFYASIQRPSDDIASLPSTYVTLTGVIESDVKIAEDAQTSEPRSVRFLLAVQEVTVPTGEMGSAPRTLPVSGVAAVRLYFPSSRNAAAGLSEISRNSLPRYGDRVTVHGHLEHPEGARNPGGFDYGAYLARKDISAALLVRRPKDLQRLESSGLGNLFLKLSYRLKQGVLEPARRMLPPEQAGALNGILLGERGDLPADLSDAFERTGTSHILATAGLHVGMVTALLIGLLRFCRLMPKPALGLTLLALGLYVVMAGGRPSVSRAALMAAVYLIGLLLDREPDLSNALALAALILLLLDPNSLADPGFQLSFATVITIILWMPFGTRWLRRLQKRMRGEGAVVKAARRIAETVFACFLLALASQLGSAPLVAYYFHTFSIVSVAANTLVVPVIALIIALGFSAAAIYALSPQLSRPLYRLLSLLLAYVIEIVQWCAALPFAAISIASFSFLWVVACYAVIWAGAFVIQNKTDAVPEVSAS